MDISESLLCRPARQMYQDLNTGPVSGTLPILYVFLARSGKVIPDVSDLTDFLYQRAREIITLA